MGTFTTLGEAELAAVSQAFALGALRSFTPIAAGTINSNFELTTDGGKYFVRVNEGKAEVDVAWEARLVTALAASGVVTPSPLVAGDGRPYAPLVGKWVSVFPWRDGRHLMAITPSIATTFGAALAKLHVAGRQLPPSWQRRSIYDHEHLVGRFQRIETERDPELAHAIKILGEELATAAASAAVRGRASQGIIHGDLFRDNVLWQGDQISAILDFEQASGGSLAYDIAVCINDWCWTDNAPRIDVAQALLAGYQQVRRLTVSDREALPIEVRAAATRFTITRITDVYLARVANPEKDFRAFLARVEAWRGPSLGQLTAAV